MTPRYELNASTTDIHRRHLHQLLGGLRPPLDERRPRPPERRTRPLTDYLRTVDIVDLHSCPDDDCSMAVETVGIKSSLLNNNVPGWCITI